MGAGDTTSAVLRGTINSLVTSDELRGRVSAVNRIFVIGIALLPGVRCFSLDDEPRTSLA